MVLQARMSPSDDRWYNVNRDLAHCFADVVREVAARLDDDRWPVIGELCRANQVSDDDLAQACGAFCRFVVGACDDPRESMHTVLSRVGWFDLPSVAQVAYMAYLGTVVAGYFFAGVREATIGGQGPLLDCDDLRAFGREGYRALTRRRPWWSRLWRRLRRWWSVS